MLQQHPTSQHNPNAFSDNTPWIVHNPDGYHQAKKVS
jgi:hypothetical protein